MYTFYLVQPVVRSHCSFAIFQGLDHLKVKIAAKTSAGSTNIAKEFDDALDALLSEKT